MKILVLTQQYPKKDRIYRNGFVHTRVKKYRENSSDDYCVFVLNGEHGSYYYEDVFVRQGDSSDLKEVLMEKYDRIIVHFLTRKMIPVLLDHAQEIEKFVWVHGYEALKWKRRMFNFFQLDFFKYVLSNHLQLIEMKNYVEREKKTTFIFVSNWMKEVTEKDVGVSFKQFEIIPNGVDIDLFSFKSKQNLEKNILVIRPFTSRKYATDLAIDALKLLSKKDNFSDYEITIVGEGRYFKRDTRKLQNINNIKLINRFLKADEIAELHKKNGLFLCPTRQDSQGVSMCEAMSSGLVVISSNNTAIPEFVKTSETGFLTETSEEIVRVIETIADNRNKFHQMSRLASESMKEKCHLTKIVKQEIELVKGV